MPSNQLPEDVLEEVARVAYAYSWGSVDEHYEGESQKETRAYVSAIAPLIIEWARKDQAAVDAQIAEGRHEVSTGIRSIETTTFPDDGRRVADAIRAQFTPETTGEKTNA